MFPSRRKWPEGVAETGAGTTETGMEEWDPNRDPHKTGATGLTAKNHVTNEQANSGT